MIGELIEAAPDRPELLTARGTTLFWIAVQNHKSWEKGAASAAKKERDQKFRESATAAVEALAAAEERGDKQANTQFALAEARRWLQYADPHGQRANRELAIDTYRKLDSETRNGKWQFRNYQWLPGNVADLYKYEAESVWPTIEKETGWPPQPTEEQSDLDLAIDDLLNMMEWYNGKDLAAAVTGDSIEPNEWSETNAEYILGYVAGRERARAHGASDVSTCEQLASASFDSLRRTAGLTINNVNVAAATSACEAETRLKPDDARTSFLLGRVLEEIPERFQDSLNALKFAAVNGYPSAWNNLSYFAEQAGLRSLANQLHYGMFQRLVVDVFPILYPKFRSMQLDERQRDAVREFAVLASKFGSVSAHIALADSAETQTDRLFHTLAARKLTTDVPTDDVLKGQFQIAEAEFDGRSDPALHEIVAEEVRLIEAPADLVKFSDDIVNQIIKSTVKSDK